MFNFSAETDTAFVTVVTYTADCRYITPNTLTSNMVECIGGKWHRRSQTYRMSHNQYRVMCALIDAGFFPELNPNRDYGAELDRFFNPNTGEELSRAEARAKFAAPVRCNKTLELAL